MSEVAEDFVDVAYCGLVMNDRATDFLGFYPESTRDAVTVYRGMNEFQGKQAITSFYCDNAGELTKAAKRLDWLTLTATPGEPKPNGVAERTVGRIKDGIRANVAAPASTSHGGRWPASIGPSRTIFIGAMAPRPS